MPSKHIPSTSYRIRTYKEGDEIELVRIFNDCYRNFAGLVFQTVDTWIWNRILRPDIDPKGIFVIEKSEKIVGHIVISKSGKIFELGYDSAFNSRLIVFILVRRALKYVIKEGGNSIVFRAPREDDIIREVCEKLEFYERPLSTVLVFNIINFQAFLEKLLKNNNNLPINQGETILVQLTDLPIPDRSIIISLENSNVLVERNTVKKPKFTIQTDSYTMTNLILGKLSYRKAFIRLQIKVKPFWYCFTAIKFLNFLVVHDPWHIPRVY